VSLCLSVRVRCESGASIIGYREPNMPKESTVEALLECLLPLPDLTRCYDWLGYSVSSHHHRADTPGYTATLSRSETYHSGFETACPIPARLLSEAGFYSLGYADKVKCFHCGGMLEQWTHGDDPWLEHAK